MDETLIARRRLPVNRGRRVQHIWLLGGRERGGRWVVVPLLSSDGSVLPQGKESLIPIIQEYIRAGSIIYSGCWKVYKALQDKDFQHLMVNHSVNVVDPDNQNIYTQNTKKLWLDIKEFTRRPGVCIRHFIRHLRKYLFLKENEGTELHNFPIWTAKLYPPHHNTRPARPQRPTVPHQLEGGDNENCRLHYELEFLDVDTQPDLDNKKCELDFDKDYKPVFVDVHHLHDSDEEDYKI